MSFRYGVLTKTIYLIFRSLQYRKFESFLENNPDYYYNQVCGLISEGSKGRIYSGWLPIPDSEYNKLDLPKVYGLDFGYSNDPNAFVEIKYDGQYRYINELLYETGLDNLAFSTTSVCFMDKKK